MIGAHRRFLPVCAGCFCRVADMPSFSPPSDLVAVRDLPAVTWHGARKIGSCALQVKVSGVIGCLLGNCHSSLHLCHWIAATGPDVFFGMVLVVLVTKTLGPPLLVI